MIFDLRAVNFNHDGKKIVYLFCFDQLVGFLIMHLQEERGYGLGHLGGDKGLHNGGGEGVEEIFDQKFMVFAHLFFDNIQLLFLFVKKASIVISERADEVF